LVKSYNIKAANQLAVFSYVAGKQALPAIEKASVLACIVTADQPKQRG